MKKLLLLLMVAAMLPLAAGAQALRMELAENQLIMGHYNTDDVLIGTGWGKSVLRGTRPIATDMTADELGLFQGGKIVAFRVGLAQSTPVTRVFVIPVDGNGNLGEETSWECNVSDEGWNIVTLDDPYLINLPGDYSLRIGFDYEQTSSNKPISAVKVGTIYPTYCYRNVSWVNYGVNTMGNLSLQCIVENDNFPAYVIRTQKLQAPKIAITDQEIAFAFQSYNLGVGQVGAGECVYDVTIDGNYVCSLTNPVALTSSPITINGVASTTGLAVGEHTLTVTVASVNGEAIEYPSVLNHTFEVFAEGFARTMRLAEQFTSTYCTYCPLGSAALSALCDLRGDVAWVGIHQNMTSGVDVFRTTQCDSIASFQHCTGFPEGTFDRAYGLGDDGELCAVLSYNSATGGAEVFNTFLNLIDDGPASCSVNINSTFDPETRVANITVDGGLVSNFDEKMGSDCRLTVYITEDGLVASQLSSGTWINNYVHNGVLRLAVGGVKGVELKRNGNTYKNEFTAEIPEAWNVDNLNIVAFVSRPLRSGALQDLRVDQTNKRKLGERDEPIAYMRGDVDGNDKVNIDDVTLLIDVLLNGNMEDVIFEAADCYIDGKINIDDVTALIDYLLNQVWPE